MAMAASEMVVAFGEMITVCENNEIHHGLGAGLIVMLLFFQLLAPPPFLCPAQSQPLHRKRTVPARLPATSMRGMILNDRSTVDVSVNRPVDLSLYLLTLESN